MSAASTPLAAPLQAAPSKAKPASGVAASRRAGRLLQRKCACGSPTASLTGQCEECQEKKLQRGSLTAALTIGAGNDPLEAEADRVADQILAGPARPALGSAAPRIQRYSRHPGGETKTAPASIDFVLASPGRPLDSALRRDMERRFAHDFSRVRVHSDAASEKSARDVNAQAWTAGHDIVFGAGRFAPGTHEGRRLLAHELTHVVQQQRNGASSLQRKEDGDDDVPKYDPDTPDTPKAEPQDTPNPPNPSKKDAPKDAPKDPVKDAPQAAAGACGGKSLAGSITESAKRLNGSAVEASLDADAFGNTSKLGADFSFAACKVGTTWRFQLKELVVPIVSKVQPITFRKNIDSASAAEVTKDSYPDIVRDLSPTATATFNVACGSKKDKDKVTSYSNRKTYWKQQLVIDHEAFHRTDWLDKYKKELIQAESDVSAHSIPEADAKDAAAAVAKANPDLTKYMTDAYQRLCDAFTPGKESRAYDKGAPAYQKLVDEINARAKKEKW